MMSEKQETQTARASLGAEELLKRDMQHVLESRLGASAKSLNKRLDSVIAVLKQLWNTDSVKNCYARWMNLTDKAKDNFLRETLDRTAYVPKYSHVPPTEKSDRTQKTWQSLHKSKEKESVVTEPPKWGKHQLRLPEFVHRLKTVADELRQNPLHPSTDAQILKEEKSINVALSQMFNVPTRTIAYLRTKQEFSAAVYEIKASRKKEKHMPRAEKVDGYVQKLKELAAERKEEKSPQDISANEMIEYLGMNRGTFFRWAQKYPKFATALEECGYVHRVVYTTGLSQLLQKMDFGGKNPTDKQIGAAFGVSRCAVSLWKKNDPDFKKAADEQKRTWREAKKQQPLQEVAPSNDNGSSEHSEGSNTQHAKTLREERAKSSRFRSR